MFTYFIIGLPFIGSVIWMDMMLLKTRVMLTRQFRIVLTIMLTLTLFFDQILTGLPIVTYNEAHILGIYLGHVPIEDFMYTIAAVIGLGSLREYYEQRQS